MTTIERPTIIGQEADGSLIILIPVRRWHEDQWGDTRIVTRPPPQRVRKPTLIERATRILTWRPRA